MPQTLQELLHPAQPTQQQQQPQQQPAMQLAGAHDAVAQTDAGQLAQAPDRAKAGPARAPESVPQPADSLVSQTLDELQHPRAAQQPATAHGAAVQTAAAQAAGSASQTGQSAFKLKYYVPCRTWSFS